MEITVIMVIMNKNENRIFLIKFVGLFVLISFSQKKRKRKSLKKKKTKKKL